MCPRTRRHPCHSCALACQRIARCFFCAGTCSGAKLCFLSFSLLSPAHCSSFISSSSLTTLMSASLSSPLSSGPF